MGDSVEQTLKEAERAAKKQKTCAAKTGGGIGAMLKDVAAARAQVTLQRCRVAASQGLPPRWAPHRAAPQRMPREQCATPCLGCHRLYRRS